MISMEEDGPAPGLDATETDIDQNDVNNNDIFSRFEEYSGIS